MSESFDLANFKPFPLNWKDRQIKVGIPYPILDQVEDAISNGVLPTDSKGNIIQPFDHHAKGLPQNQRVLNDLIAAGLLAMLENTDLRDKYLTRLSELRLNTPPAELATGGWM